MAKLTAENKEPFTMSKDTATIYSENIGYATKTLTASVKNIDMERRMVEGYFSAFDVVDSDGDMMKKGCYEKTIKERGPKGTGRIQHLLQHDPTKPLGKVMELREDEYGLYFKSMITDTTYGTDTLKLYMDGVYKEHSVGINIIRSEHSQEERCDIVTEVKMWEGSTVTWGANEMALGGMAKGEDVNALMDRYHTLTKAFYNGDYTDDTFKIIEHQKEHIEAQIKKALQSYTPQPSTYEDDAAERLKALFTEKERQTKLKGIFNV